MIGPCWKNVLGSDRHHIHLRRVRVPACGLGVADPRHEDWRPAAAGVSGERHHLHSLVRGRADLGLADTEHGARRAQEVDVIRWRLRAQLDELWRDGVLLRLIVRLDCRPKVNPLDSLRDLAKRSGNTVVLVEVKVVSSQQ